MKKSQKYENLVSTMKCDDFHKLYEKLNLSSSAIIINQKTSNNYYEYYTNNSQIRCFSFDEKGIGLSRNSALMRSNADICLLSDDDMVYVDNYIELVDRAYKENPSADFIIFDVRVHKNGEVRNAVTKKKKINFLNFMRFGAVTFSFKREKIISNNIFFSLNFGGGTKYGSGEDTLFIADVLKNKLNIIAVPYTIADIYNDDSSWFTGYNKKFFYDKGALFKKISKKTYILLIMQFIIRKKKIVEESGIKKIEIFKIMVKGAKEC